MEEKKKRSKLPLAVIAGALVIAIAGGALKGASVAARKNALNTMAGLTEERVQLIENLFTEGKKTLTLYADAPEIKALLEDPDNDKAVEEAQEFTEYYSEHIDDLEGIYASELSTHVLTHTNKQVVGMITRADTNNQKKLMEAMLDSEDGLYNCGIIMSPASGRNIVSMYKIIPGDDDGYIGFAGLGLIADSLLSNDIPSMKGIKSASYKIINVNNRKYIFGGDSDAAGNDITNDSLLSLCSELSGTDSPAKGNIEYKDENGSYIAAYSYMPECGTLVMLEGKSR